MKKRGYPQTERRGAALVEFSIVLPVMLTLVLGTIELGYALRATNILTAAVREGGRLASMDFSDKLDGDETATDKVTRDIRNFITASGIDGSAVAVSIVHEGGDYDGQAFDLSDSDNNLELFRVTATLPYANVSIFPLTSMSGKTLKGSTVFRATRASLAN